MTDRELMQQALDALKVMRPACFAETTLKAADTAITALRDRLAQTEQGPVAWIWKYANGEEEVVFVPPHRIDLTHEDAPSTIIPLYTTPRQWVGLTEEDKAGFWTADQMTIEEWDTLFNEIEAALKENNT